MPSFNRAVVGICTCCTFVTALVLLAVSIALVILFPVIQRGQVEERVVLQEGSATFQQLLSPTVPLFKDIYFFNLTNPIEFEGGAKPQLVEIGPYSYRETREKTVVSISADGTLLTYNQTRLFHFSQETSGDGLTETDTICTINLPLVGAVAQLKRVIEQGDPGTIQFGEPILQYILNETGARLFVCLPPTPLAWQYSDDLIRELNSNFALRIAMLSYPRTFVSIQLNNSADNALPSVIHTGLGNVERIGQYEQWQGNNQTLDIWPNGMGANDINGTEGFFFHPLLEQGDDLEIFVDDAFRTFQLVYGDTVNDMGIQAFRYQLANSTFESAFTNPENVRWGSWCPDGLFFLGATQDPVVPVFGSKPHFLDGDPGLRDKVAGLEPNRSRHDSFIDVEPLTGANVQLNVQLQINIQVNQTQNITQLSNINGTLYFPILYLNEHTVLTQEFVDFLLDSGLRESDILQKLVWALLGAMCVVVVLSFCCTTALLIKCCMRRKSKSTDTEDKVL